MLPRNGMIGLDERAKTWVCHDVPCKKNFDPPCSVSVFLDFSACKQTGKKDVLVFRYISKTHRPFSPLTSCASFCGFRAIVIIKLHSLVQERSLTKPESNCSRHSTSPMAPSKPCGRPKVAWDASRKRKLVRLYLMTDLKIADIQQVLSTEGFTPKYCSALHLRDSLDLFVPGRGIFKPN